MLEDLVSEDERRLFGDKAYDRDSLKQMARDDGWYYGILDKGKRNDPLSSTQKKAKQTSPAGSLTSGASVCIDQRSLWPAMGPGQNKDMKQSSLCDGVYLLEHRTRYYLIKETAEYYHGKGLKSAVEPLQNDTI